MVRGGSERGCTRKERGSREMHIERDNVRMGGVYRRSKGSGRDGEKKGIWEDELSEKNGDIGGGMKRMLVRIKGIMGE